MARNEEKQLARLNRFYLQQHKEEELRKRPPRPRLEALSSVDDIKKWIPSILKDIEFYVKQMEVSCYPKRTIEEFEKRISHLRGEYKAFVRKAHELEPDLSATPWSDRPYSSKRKKLNTTLSDKCSLEADKESECPAPTETSKCESPSNSASFVRLSTPLLLGLKSCPEFYGSWKSEHEVQPELDTANQDQPLDFNFNTNKKPSVADIPGSASSVKNDNSSVSKLNDFKDFGETSGVIKSIFSHDVEDKLQNVCKDKEPANVKARSHVGSTNQPLNLPYSDSSSSDEET